MKYLWLIPVLSVIFFFFSNIYQSVWWLSPAGLCNSWETENWERFQCDLCALIALSQPGATASVGSHQEKTFTLQKLLRQQNSQQTLTGKKTRAERRNEAFADSNHKNDIVDAHYCLWMMEKKSVSIIYFGENVRTQQFCKYVPHSNGPNIGTMKSWSFFIFLLSCRP